MLLRRLSCFGNVIARRQLIRSTNPAKAQIRKSGGNTYYGYRAHAYDPNYEFDYIICELLAGVFWANIFWHIYIQPGHLFGEFPFPDETKWTDEELGIPPDDVD